MHVFIFIVAHDNLDTTLVEHMSNEQPDRSPSASLKATEHTSDDQLPPVSPLAHDTSPVEDTSVEQPPPSPPNESSPGKTH